MRLIRYNRNWSRRVRAKTISYEDYVACGGEVLARDAGKMRLEGKDYIVQDGDAT